MAEDIMCYFLQITKMASYSVLIFASTFYNDFCGFDRKIHFRRFTR
nr:MAG TPA: hypothetical protein [Caudoviricetes sp.]